jgi:aspartyl aminopeptidase
LQEAGAWPLSEDELDDVAGGSTLGNILASTIPLRGVDMGNAILAMHSCRETGSTADHIYCVKAFTKFFS